MKRSKLFFSTLVMIMVLIVTSMQNAHAQMQVFIAWTTPCPDTCTSHSACSYFVEYSIYDLCGQDPVRICQGNTTIGCADDPPEFECPYDCEGATHDPCFFVTARATKFCTGPLGTIAICTGDGYAFGECSEFISPGVTVYITWN